MSDTQQIEIIGSDMVEFTKISANAWKRDGGEFNYCFFFFFKVYIETSLLQSSLIFLAIKIVYLLLQVVYCL